VADRDHAAKRVPFSALQLCIYKGCEAECARQNPAHPPMKVYIDANEEHRRHSVREWPVCKRLLYHTLQFRGRPTPYTER
jgi:hypothetical protein